MTNGRTGRSGLDGSAVDTADIEGGPGPQPAQDWPGEESRMRPRPDHGEDSYRGSGRLEGKRALITGADSGIGKAIAIAFAREGADIAFSYLDEDDDAFDTVEWVEKAGRTVVSIAGDLTDPAHCNRVVAGAVEELGGIDILVNNAAYHCQTASLEDVDDDQLERTFATNILAPIRLTRAALPHLDEGAVILNTGSVVALRGSPELLEYTATKGAIHAFTQSLAIALADRKIRVNCVAPGPVWTPLIPSTKDPEDVEEFGADTHWGRPAQPAELAPAFVFFASDDSRFCTGEILAVTGDATSR